MAVKQGVTFCVAVDGSEESFKGVEHALKLCKKDRGDKLILLMVQPRSTVLESLVDPFDMLHIPDKQLRVFAKNKIAEIEQRCKQANVPFESKVIVTDSNEKEELLSHVDILHPDLLVIGRRGLGRIAKMVLGSTSDYCLKNASCPVYVV